MIKLPIPNFELKATDKGAVFMALINSLIQAVKDCITAYNNQIDAATTAEQHASTALAASQGRIAGDGSPGTQAFNIASGVFSSVSNKMYFHIKLPTTTKAVNELFLIRVHGFNYQESSIIDCTFAGHASFSLNSIINTDVAGNHNPFIYKDDDGHVICRLNTTSSTYMVTLSVDTMRQGVGRLFAHGDVTITMSDQEFL